MEEVVKMLCDFWNHSWSISNFVLEDNRYFLIRMGLIA